jgi:hypothetical protein
MRSSLASLVAAACCAATCVQATTIPAGTRVIVETTEALNTRTLRQGDTFTLRLAEPIVAHGKTVVPAGATGVGEVIDTAPAGRIGKPAKLVLAARYLDFGGQRVGLKALRLVRQGQGRDQEVLVLSVAVGIAAFLVKGGEIEIPNGTTAEAKLSQDLNAPDDSEAVKP